MRNLLSVFSLLLAACSATSVAELPEPLYTDGTSFALPCQEHGSHLQTITAHSLSVLYTIVDDQGNVQEVPEGVVTEVLESFGIELNEKSGQQTSTNQVETTTGQSNQGRCSGGSPEQSGNR